MQPSTVSITNSGVVRCVLRLKKHNISELERLHRAVYGKNALFGFFDKKYNTAYTGVEYVGFIAYNYDMLPIAFYGVIPCFMSINGQKILTAQSADTMTHPDYRGLGLFIRLAEQTYELCENLGIKFLFGFPNQNSLPGFINKLGWQVQENMSRFTIPVKTLPFERIALKFPVLQPAYRAFKKNLLGGDSDSLVFENPFLKQGFDGIWRDVAYVTYKGYSNTCFIQCGDAQVWLKLCGSLFIGDIANANAENFKQVMGKLLRLAAKLGLGSTHFHCSPETPIYALFSKHYKSEPSFPVIVKDLGSGLNFEKIKFTFADIDIF